MALPLTPQEQNRVRVLLVWLHAVKVCAACGVTKSISDFGRYGAEACMQCEMVQWTAAA